MFNKTTEVIFKRESSMTNDLIEHSYPLNLKAN